MSFTTLFYALIAGVIPSFVWLVFWLREDTQHPEPRWLIMLSFAGGAVAVVLAIFGEKLIVDFVSNQNTRYILWAALEESLKLGVISVIALHTHYYDEPIDAMIYLVTIALGFTAIENTLFISESFINGAVGTAIAMESTRFVGATLVHVVCSAIIGFAMGFAFYRSKIVKIFAVIGGLTTAILLHSVFNLSIINATPKEVIQIFAWVWIAVVILIMMFEEIKAVKQPSPNILK